MMKHFLLLMMGALLGMAPMAAQPDLDMDFDDCGCPIVNTPPVCAEIMPGLVVPVPSACIAECLGFTVIEGGDCAMDWNGGDFDGWEDEDEDDDEGDDDDFGDDDYGNWMDSTWTGPGFPGGDWDDDDYGDYGDWMDSTWTGPGFPGGDLDDDDVFVDWTDSTWTGGGFPGGGWNDSLVTDIDFDLLDSLLNDWLANGGADLVDSLLGGMGNGGVVVIPDWVGDVNLDSLLASGDFGWLDSLLVGGGFPWDGPGFPGGGLDSLLGDINWNELDSLLNGGGLDSIGTGGLTWWGLNIDLDGIWEDKGPEAPENFGTGQVRQGSEGTAQLPVTLDWTCFPVPAATEFNIQADGLVNRMELWNLSGQRLIQSSVPFDGRAAFDVSTLASGTYIVRIQGESGQWSSQTLLIQ